MKGNQLPLNYSGFIKAARLIKGKRTTIDFSSNNDIGNSYTHYVRNIKRTNNDKVQEIFSSLIPYSKYLNVYLHGSWADETRTPFSDLDDFIVVDFKKLKTDKLDHKVFKILNDIDMELCRIDPLQHHGHWVCTVEELDNFDNSFIPIHILDNAKLVLGASNMKATVNLDSSKDGLKNNIIGTCQGIERFSEILFANKINMYQLKGLVGSFALMPAFIFQCLGKNVTKPAAIQQAKTLFSEEAYQCIMWATDCRNNWGVLTNSKKYKLFSLLPYLVFDPHLWRRFSNRFSPKISKNQRSALSQIKLENENINRFIQESQYHVR